LKFSGKVCAPAIVTTSYPETPVEISRFGRGRPEIDWPQWKDARLATAACPTGAISYQDTGERRVVRLDWPSAPSAVFAPKPTKPSA